MEFCVLGPFEVRAAGRALALGGPKPRGLLALLLLHPREPVSAERIALALWGEDAPTGAAKTVQVHVSRLRRALGDDDVLVTTSAGYSIRPGDGELDAERFAQLVADGRSALDVGDAVRASSLLHEALALWRGPPLADSELEDFAQAEIHRLEDFRLGVIEERIAADLELEADAELAAELELLVRTNPLRERLRSQLMLTLYRAGRQADALAAYHEARRTLVDELGIEPGPELQTLYGSILRQERSLVRVAPPALADHYDEVMRAFSAGRLVPVLGPSAGGVAGEELARLLADRFQLDAGAHGLAYISQAVAARNGIGPLHDELHLALDRDVEPSPLHAWLAALPPLLRTRGLPQQLIVSTCLHTGIERAFDAAGEELDVVAYLAAGRNRGKFLHIAPDGSAVVVDEPNSYTGLSLEERSVLLKIHGHVDRGGSRERESFAVSEDDHIDYLVGGDAAGAVPVQLAARLRRSHLLFLGYAVDDWSLRVFLRRIWGGDRLAYRSWAVQQGSQPVATELWRERGADVYDVSIDAYAEQLVRLTAGLDENAA
jgi:DNA-binding SARP family transcriptional activator